MSVPSSNTDPVDQPLSDSSCMRLRQRRNVLLPQPDGPMMAVTVFVGKKTEVSFTAILRPNNALSRRVSMRTIALSGRLTSSGPCSIRGAPWDDAPAATVTTGTGTAGATAGTLARRAIGRSDRGLVAKALPGCPARRQGQGEDQRHEDERRRPGDPVPVFERSRRVSIDQETETLHRLANRRREVQVAERREQQRRGLAGNTGYRDECASDDATHGRAGHDRERRSPARVSQRQGRFS